MLAAAVRSSSQAANLEQLCVRVFFFSRYFRIWHNVETFRGWKVMLLARIVLFWLGARAMGSYDCRLRHNWLILPGLLSMVLGLVHVIQCSRKEEELSSSRAYPWIHAAATSTPVEAGVSKG